MRLELVSAPAAEPIVLADAKVHLRHTGGNAEDALINRLIKTARHQVEAHTRRRLITQTWRYLADEFCSSIVLPDSAPVASIASVKYIDANGALQTLDPSVYMLLKEAPARVELAYGQDWPTIRGDREGVRIEVVCGYGADGSAVPDALLSAMYLMIEHLYGNRGVLGAGDEIELPMGFEALLSQYVVPSF